MKHIKKGIDYNLSFEEIAVELGISINQAKYAYYKAMSKFRRKLK